jgi:hypothetical protein
MTEHSPVSIDDVRALVAERHRFDDWLSALEGRRAETPEHVYARVHGDYLTRRERVLSQLHAQAPALSELLASLDARSEALAARMGAQEDERTEAMLRHAVGEFDDAAWHAVRDRVESSLQEMGVEHGELEAQRADVRQLLSEAKPAVATSVEPAAPPADAAPAVAVASETPSWLSDDDVVADEVAPQAEPEAASPADAPHDDAPDRVISITETLAAIEADVVDEVPPASSDEANGLIRPPMSAGLERPNFWGTRESGVPTADPSDTEPQDLYGDTTADRGVAADSGGAAPPAESFDELAFLRSVIDPQSQAPTVPKAPGTDTPQKTLRCTECGTMNLPTEWYCERCGGELATF